MTSTDWLRREIDEYLAVKEPKRRTNRKTGKGREGWKKLVKIAGIPNLRKKTSTVKWLLSPRDFADVILPNTKFADPRGENTCFPWSHLLIGAASG